MSFKMTHLWQRFSPPVVASLFLACTATELSAPRSHPGNSLAPTAQIAFATPLPRAQHATEAASPLPADSAVTEQHHHQGSDATTPTDSKAPAATFTCVMHPEIVRDQPGNCPICGMKLVPKKDGK